MYFIKPQKINKGKTLSMVGLAICFWALNACQSLPYQPYARDTKKKPQQGGVIALKLEHRSEDSALAQQLMASNCGPKPVKVIEEGEVVIGEKTSTQADESYRAGEKSNKVGSLFGIPVMSGGRDPNTQTRTEANVTQLKEWQIVYECEGKTTAEEEESTIKSNKGRKAKSTL